MAALRLLFIALLLVGTGLAGAATGQELVEERCEAPIQTCRSAPSFDTHRPDILPAPECPRGYECVCVPSCPDCKDCAAQVCVRAPERECKTACDCPVGAGCFENQCLFGFAPVWCCERDKCPAGDRCDNRDGTQGRCEPDPNPMCELRERKATTAVARIVEKFNRCDRDDECVPIDTSTQCRGDCPQLVNRRGAHKAAELIDRIDRKICDGYQEDGCPYATPSCIFTVPVCIDHKCVGVAPPSPPSPRPIESVVSPVAGQILDLQRRP